MNRVTIEGEAPKPVYSVGSWWKNSAKGSVYELCVIEGKFVAVSIGPSGHWSGLHVNREDAVEGLEFLCASADVVVRPHGAKRQEPAPKPQSQEDSDWAWYRENCRRVDVLNGCDGVEIHWLCEDNYSRSGLLVESPTFSEALRELREAVEGGEG